MDRQNASSSVALGAVAAGLNGRISLKRELLAPADKLLA
jgi:hypothetical protein